MLSPVHAATFVTVIEEGGFREAARRLGTSQPTVTQHIKKLEETLGARLVLRSHAVCTPTARGARLLPYARRLIKAAEEAHAVVADQKLLIGASSNIGTYLLQPALRAFLDRHDAAGETAQSLGSNPQVAERLCQGELDLALMEWWDDRPGFEATTWRREPVVVIVPPQHPWAKRDSVTRRLLLTTPMIGGEPGSGTATLLARTFGRAATELRISLSLGSTEAVKQAVKAGLGVSLVLESAVREQVDAGLLHALPIAGVDLRKDLFVLLPEGLPATSPAKAFAGFLMEIGEAL